MKKNILITGVSSGIGKDASRVFLEKGWKVIGSLRDEIQAQKLTEEFGSSFLPVIFDVRSNEAIKASKSKIEAFCGDRQLDGIINNAGYAHPGPLTLLQADELGEQLDVNVLGIMRVTNCFFELLKSNPAKQRAGKIINISSISGLFNSPFVGAYCISKHAVESMTEIYRRELYIHNIDVIAIQPGPIKTKIWGKSKGKLDRFKDSEYGEILAKADKSISQSENNALDVEKVSALLLSCMESRKMSTKNVIHKNKLGFNIVRSIIPARLVDKLIWRSLRNKNPKNRPA